ncbi:MAG: ABC transporter substrate-binding protein [Acidaminococcaceae bacterium]
MSSKTTKNRWALLGCICLAGALMLGCGGTATKATSKTIVLSDAGWDSVKFHNAVVNYICTKGYATQTTTLTGSTPITHAALLRGDADVNLETWSDNIPTYQEDVKTGKIVELGINFDDNKQGFYVPRYVLEGDAARGIAPMAPELKTVSDLKDYSDLFVDEEQPGKGRIYGAIPGWAIDEIMYKKFLYYALNANYNYFRPGSDSTLNAAFVAAYAKGEPIVGYNWEPTWLSGKLDLVLLEDAPFQEEAYLQGKTAMRGVPVTIAANPSFLQKQPQIAAFLKKYHTSSALTAEALAYINDHKASYDDAAQHFLRQHPELLKLWLPAEQLQLVEQALAENKGGM